MITEQCHMHDIQFTLLLPSATHLLQPFDLASFHPLEQQWRKVLHDWKTERYGAVQKQDFPWLLLTTVESIGAQATANLQAGFKSAGIPPLNKKYILSKIPCVNEIATSTNSISSTSGLDTLSSFTSSTSYIFC